LLIPGLLLATLVAAHGEPLSGRVATVGAAELRAALTPAGRPLVVHVWASWCVPCRAEWPALGETLRRSPAVDVVTVAVEAPDTRAEAASVLLAAGRVPGRALTAPAGDVLAAMRRLDPEWDGGLPSTYLYGPDGRLILAQRGITRLDELDSALRAVSKKRKERSHP
jgi:thiol-disulfide isomerase/thioredoxin